MAHFAKIENKIVTDVIVAEQEHIDGLDGTWVQTSYNTYGGVHSDKGTPLRYNYARIGGNYDASADAFYDVNPFDSWTLDTDTYTWKPPVEYPDDGKLYQWDEANKQWVESD